MENIHELVEQTFRQEAGRVRAALISKLGDFTLAEDALQDALLTALLRWPVDGVPRNSGAWLLTTAWHKAIDIVRRRVVLERKQEMLQILANQIWNPGEASDEQIFPDERLKLI